MALGGDASEANYAWLRDVQARLAEVDGRNRGPDRGVWSILGPAAAQRLIKK